MDWFKDRTQQNFEDTEGYLLVTPQGRCDLALTGAPEGTLEPEGPRLFLRDFWGRELIEAVSNRGIRFSIDDLSALTTHQVSPQPWQAPDRESFCSRVGAAQRLFATSELKKVVPVVRWTQSHALKLDQVKKYLDNVLSYFQKERPHAYVYAAWSPSGGFLGLSPEILFQTHRRRLSTMALAGTAWGGKLSGALVEDPKENHEHALVVEDLLQKLNRFGDFHAKDKQILRYGRLEHLFTPIEGELKAADHVRELVGALHPSAALGGFPQAAARDWLVRQPEAEWRRFFGAPMTWIWDDEILSLVLIRGIFWNSHRVDLPCGCGIVADSVAVQEWVELEQKYRSVLTVLAGGRT